MRSLICERCGANGMETENGYRICKYCGTVYQLTVEDILVKESVISVSSDVENLLMKCRLDPRNAKKYANLILDIDPNNKEVLKYL